MVRPLGAMPAMRSKGQVGCPCCTTTGCGVVTGTIENCAPGGHVLAGITVELIQGGVTVSTSTTASDGTYSLPFSAGGFTQVRISHPNYTTKTISISGPFGSSASCLNPGPYTASTYIVGNDTAWTCYCADVTSLDACYGTGRLLLPATLYISDGFGTVTLQYVSAGVSVGWNGCAMRTAGGQTFDAFKACTGAASVSVPVKFSVQCRFDNTFDLTLTFPTCQSAGPGSQLHPIADGSCAAFPTGGNVGSYGYINTGVGTAPTSCDPLAVSFSGIFPATPTPYTPARDIYGGSATFTVSE